MIYQISSELQIREDSIQFGERVPHIMVSSDGSAHHPEGDKFKSEVYLRERLLNVWVKK